MINGFKEYDANGDGTMDSAELKKLLVDLGMREITDEKVEECMK